MNTNLTKPTPTKDQKGSHGHNNKKSDSTTTTTLAQTTNYYAPATATIEKIPTETWGPFTICVVVFLVILTCLILNCSRIRRKVDQRRMRRQNDKDPERLLYPPIVFTDEKLSTPETTYSSKRSSGSSNSSHSTVPQRPHYHPSPLITTIEPVRTNKPNAFPSYP
jgi:hypothetical protein